LHKRLRLISGALREVLSRRGRYRVVDNDAAAKLIADPKTLQDLRHCNGCEHGVGHALNANTSILCWVQKVSNLILSINIEVRDIRSGNTLHTKSVDPRSNSDNYWLHGVRHMIDSFEENKQYLLQGPESLRPGGEEHLISVSS
jgi:hypothetical protein